MCSSTGLCKRYRFASEIIQYPVHGELILNLQREAGIALGSEPANGSCAMWFAVLDYLQPHQPAYHRRVSYGCDVGCNRPGSLRVFSPSQPHSRIVYGQEVLGESFRWVAQWRDAREVYTGRSWSHLHPESSNLLAIGDTGIADRCQSWDVSGHLWLR